MPADDTAGEVPRPPGRRSIQLCGPLPIRIGPAEASANVPGKGRSGVAAGVGLLKPHHTTTAVAAVAFPRRHKPFASSASALSQTSFASTSPRRCLSSVSSVTAVGAANVEGEATATTSPRRLRGRLNEGTVHRTPLVLPAVGETGARSPQPPSTTRQQSTIGSSKSPTYGPSVVSWVRVASGDAAEPMFNSHTHNDGSVSCSASNHDNFSQRSCVPGSETRHHSRATATTVAAIAQMVNEASLHNTWAVRFPNTVALRQAVSTAVDAYTAFEEALVAELNTLRRAPTEYAAIVEREATVTAPYVREDDTYFASEAAAEEAAAQLRRRVEQEARQEVAVPTIVSSAAMPTTNPTTGSMSRLAAATANANVSPKHASAGVTTTAAAAAMLPEGTERKKGKKRHSNSVDGATPSSKEVSTSSSAGADRFKDSAAKVRGGEQHKAPDRTAHQPPLPSPSPPQSAPDKGTGTPGAVTPHFSTPVQSAPQALTLAELRHQFRCQQRYRAALETAVTEVRAAQRQAEAAQLAAWAAEDEKAQKRVRRPTANTNSIGSPAYSAMGGGGGGGNGGSVSSFKKLSSASSVRRGSPALDETVLLRRSEEATQVHRTYEQQVQRLEMELQRARSACQRSLAGGNLIAGAVRALREADVAPPLRPSRWLSLAARETAEVYYGDEERVSALVGLYALSRATLVGLPDPMGQSAHSSAGCTSSASSSAASAFTKNSLMELSRRRERISPDGVDTSAAFSSDVLTVLSEEALLLAQVAQRACSMYGYISNEVRGVHLQGVGTPRTLMLQLILGCFTPVVGIKHEPAAPNNNASSDRPAGGFSAADSSDITAGASESALRCYAGVRLEGSVYAAHPDCLSSDASEHDVPQRLQPQEGANAEEFGDKNGSHCGSAGRTVSGAGAGVRSSSSKETSDVAVQRLWPLLWPGASAVGCGWQQVRGWRPVPTYTEARQRLEAEQRAMQLVRVADNTPATPAAATPEDASVNKAGVNVVGENSGTAVVCTTLLLASGFAGYEVGCACSGMTPAATRRVVVELTKDAGDAGGAYATGDSNDVRRAAVEVHSNLGVTLLTPTVHPVVVPLPPSWPSSSSPGSGQDGSGTVVCVAVSVPGDGGAAEGLRRTDDTAAAVGSVPSSIRVAAQVTRLGQPTPSYPSVDATEVLVQRSPVDPSVWLVLVDAAAAFAQHSTPHGAADGGGAAGLLALHLFAKDVQDVTAGYEHVAFIRLQRVLGSGAAADSAGGCSPILMAPEWCYLLRGLSCVPSRALVGRYTTATPTPCDVVADEHGSAATTHASFFHRGGGWAVLHEPLLGRDGVVLHPLSSNFRAGNGNFCPTCSRDVHLADSAPSVISAMEARGKLTAPAAVTTGGGNGGGCGDAIYVAIQLPTHANVLWWGRRLAALHAARDALIAEVAAEEEKGVRETTAAATSSTAPVDAFHEAGVGGTPAAGADGSATPVSPTTAPQTPTPPPSSHANTAAATSTTTKGKPNSGDRLTSKRASRKRDSADAEASPTEQKSGKGATKTPTRVGGGGRSSSPSPTPSFALSSPKAGVTSSSFSGLASFSGRRTLSFHLTADMPDSPALLEYEALWSASPNPQATAVGVARAAASTVGVPPHLQASHISLAALRSLNARLHADAQVWQAHLMRIQPLLDNERERIAGEVTKKKGKEQQRLQHEQDDVTKEMAEVQRRTAVLTQALDSTEAALRKRERAQVLRRARLERVTAALSRLEATAPPNAALQEGDRTGNDAAGGVLAAPRVTLRLFDKAAVVAGSGRNVVALTQSAAEDQANVLDLTVNADGGRDIAAVVRAAAAPTAPGVDDSVAAAAAVAMNDNVVVLQPQSMPLLSASEASLCGATPGVVYAGSCSVPPSFSGQATLLIDGEVAVTWTL